MHSPVSQLPIRPWTCLILFITAHMSQVYCKSKHVTVSVDAKWSETPLSSEASEYFAKESTDLFWQYVDHVTSFEEAHVHGASQEDHYTFITSAAEKLLPQQQIRLFHFSMSIRAHSPTVEMHAQLARDYPVPECDAFYEVHGTRVCDLKYLDSSISEAKERPSGLRLDTDHVYTRAAATDSVTIVLYGEIGRDSFRSLHQMLKFYADRGKITYIIRHYSGGVAREKVRLSGYGVELAIKSQEYKAQDDTKIQDDKGKEQAEKDDGPDEVQGFLFSTLKKLHPDNVEDLMKFREHLQSSTNQIAALKVWQLQDLSYQAAHKIVSAGKEEQLATLRTISQNFPLMAGQLAKTPVTSELRAEIKRNQLVLERQYGMAPGDSALFLNGVQLDLELQDAFSLVDLLAAEVKLLDGLTALGLRARQMADILRIDVKDQEAVYALDIRERSIMYVNDLEKDRRYQMWPSDIQELLKPTFPGMLRHMAKNMFHLIFMVDPADKVSIELLRMAEAFFVHNAPIRIGILLIVNDDEVVDGNDDLGVALYRGFQFSSSKEGYGKGLSFLTDVYDRVQQDGWSVDTVKAVLSDSLSAGKISDMLGPDSKYDKGRLEGVDYFMRTGLKTLPQVLINGKPLQSDELAQDMFEEAVVGAIMKATPDLQRAVYNRQLTGSMSVLDWLMRQPNVMPRLNQRVFNTAKSKYISYAGQSAGTSVEHSADFLKLSNIQMAVALSENQKYLTKNEEPTVRPVTMDVVADFESPSGRALLQNALRHLKSSNQVRLGFVHNPVGATDQAQTTFWSRLLRTAVQFLPTDVAKQFITKLAKAENGDELTSGNKPLSDFEVHGMDMAGFETRFQAQSVDFLITHSAYCRFVLNLKPGQRAVVVNGRVVGPFDEDEAFAADDFGVLEKHTMKTVAEKVEEAVSIMDFDEAKVSDLIMKISAQILGNPQSSSARKIITDLDETYSAVRILPSRKDTPFEITAILDPLSRDAQRIAPLIMVLQEILDSKVVIYMNCKEKLSEMPLKNFYRFVLEPRLQFLSGSVLGPVAKFTELPHALLLTMNVDPPQGWMVEATRTPYDLDNIRLQEISQGVTAFYELEHLLLEGHCFDTTSGGAPPRGLQFTLGTNSTPVLVDTIVMANLGYFQLKANPGAWLLRLREGKSKDIYDILGIQDFSGAPAGHDVIVAMDSFKSKILKVKVAKKQGKLGEDVLDSGKEKDGARAGLWDSISRSFGTDTETVQVEKDETLNIFSVASGHLYERFLRIMMLGVLKHTKSKVKFWFLKNYLSPSFKETIPLLAKHYGFEYELVQYKWPRWLHRQTEKQRIIWGYKILFLDVLFPLDVKKIIFVDADQIVRADLQELYDLDLEGAPYGYTPFCDSRTEMEGFRFWKSGYWSSHLGHRKYHISALYVVDLVKFRRIAAGDRLRGQYQGLSQDPNSLSNLDQDLPNNMIHQVAIKSLPMEWLWCETWCSDAEKKKAKTIDLCNNPQTKEPKLTAARRIAPEWNEYDQEIRMILDKKHKTQKQVPSSDSLHQDTSRDEL